MENTPLLDDYILRLSGKKNPRICFIPTACGDADSYSIRFFRRFSSVGCYAFDLQLVRRQIADLENYIMSMDILYVGGGNTANMLAIWREHGVDTFLKRAWSTGKILCGISAGSICWFEYGITDSFGPGLKPLKCLGFIPGSNCPHYDGEIERRPAYQSAIKSGLPSGYAAEDGAAIHFVNGQAYKCISSRPHAKVYRVALLNSQVQENALETTFLGQE